MRKTFPLESPKHKPARVIESIVNDVRKYLKRERRKKLPEDVDFWDFDCRIGADSENAEAIHVAVITDAIHKSSENGWATVYVEIIAKPGHRSKKDPVPKIVEEDETPPTSLEE